MYREGRYSQIVYWWDKDDNEYTLEGLWKYYPLDREINQGDEAELLSLEVFDQEPGAPDIDHLLDKDGDIWQSVEDDFSTTRAQYIDDDWY